MAQSTAVRNSRTAKITSIPDSPPVTPITALPADVREDLAALARMRHASGDRPQAVCDAVNHAARDHGFRLSGAAVLIRQAVSQLAAWSPVADWQASLATLPADMEAWRAAQPQESVKPPASGLSPDDVQRREHRRKRRDWKRRVVTIVRGVLEDELPEAVGVLLSQQKGGKQWVAA